MTNNPQLRAQLEAMAKKHAHPRGNKWEVRRECRLCHHQVRRSDLKAAGGFNNWECIESRACEARRAFGWPAPGDHALDFAVCSCRESYTRGDYIGLPCPPNGSKQPTYEDDGRPFDLELRNCLCGSTMARRLR